MSAHVISLVVQTECEGLVLKYLAIIIIYVINKYCLYFKAPFQVSFEA